jgi:hypothetical protein
MPKLRCAATAGDDSCGGHHPVLALRTALPPADFAK